jgi:5-methylcytosine-specific restriction endonuclease McrA
VKRYSLSHLSDDALLRDLASAIARERTATAEVLAHIAEVDTRRLYVPAGYPSMYLYCVRELHLSEDAAFKRIQAARAARRFPAILDGLASGRLHLTGVGLLVPHLTEDNAAELLAAAAQQTKVEIETMLADRFPKSDLLTWVAAMPSAGADRCAGQLAPAQVGEGSAPTPDRLAEVSQPVSAHVDPRPRVAPLSRESFGLQVTLGRCTHQKLRRAQELLGHQIPSGDIAQVLDRVLDLAIAELEKRKFAATAKPRRCRRPTSSPRHIPADVQRAVWERDGGQCTFVTETGHRCEARKPLEFDHVQEVARGGEASVEGIRLRCRAHNQYEAERTFGSEFMRHKRIAAVEARAAKSRGSGAGRLC